MSVSQFDLTRQYAEIEEEVVAKVAEILASGKYILGPYVKEFESAFANYLEKERVFGVASGTDAILLALEAGGVKAGDEVITTPFTFFATAEVIGIIGAKPVFVDIDPVSLNLDPAKIEEKITEKTKAIIPVHLFGLSCDMDPIMQIAKKHNLIVIEDTAQAAGAEYKGKKCGAIGDFGAFSFFPTKNLACMGDGGATSVSNPEFANRLEMLRKHGSKRKYFHDFLGHNSRLDAIQAGILSVKLNHLDEWNEKRRKNAKFYNDALREFVLQVPDEPQDYFHIYHQYTIRVENRDKLSEYLKGNEIGHAVYYPLPLHLQPALEGLTEMKKGELAESEKACKEVISLPIFPEMYKYELEEVVDILKGFFKG